MQTPLNQMTPTDSTPQWVATPEFDIKVYVRLIWHWLWLIILCMVLASTTAYVVSDLSMPIYQASTTLLVNQARNATANYQDLITSERIASTYAQLMKRASTLAAVAAEFDVTPDMLNSAVTAVNVTPIRDTQLIQVTIEGTSPELVAAVAETLPQVFITEMQQVQESRFIESKANLQKRIQDINDQINQKEAAIAAIGDSYTAEQGVELNRLRSQVTQLQSSYNSQLESLEMLNLTVAQSMDTITVAEPPSIPTTPIRPRTIQNTLLAAIVGVMLALGIIFLVEYLDDRVRSPQDLERIVDTTILSTISLLPNTQKQGWRKAKVAEPSPLITIAEPRHPISESYRTLRTNLQFASVDNELRSILITSATESEGKTTTVANLGIVMAQAGKRVIIIDSDLRKPRLNRVLKVSGTPGITDALWREEDNVAAYLRETAVPGLRILSSGKIPPNPADLLGSQRMRRLIESLQKEADLLIFDVPPLLAVTDASILAQFVQGIVLVVDTSRTSRAAVSRAVETLFNANANLFGVVLNRMTRNARSYGYYYYDSYGRYYGDDVDPNDPPPTEKPGSGKSNEGEMSGYQKNNRQNRQLPQPATHSG